MKISAITSMDPKVRVVPESITREAGLEPGTANKRSYSRKHRLRTVELWLTSITSDNSLYRTIAGKVILKGL